MRFVLAVVLSCLALPAFAQSGERYENARYGFTLDIPAGFIGMGESANGDGQAYAIKGRPTELAVWGGTLLGDLEREVSQRVQADTDQGWTITDQVSTPRWAGYSASRNGQILHQRMILLCDGASYAAFRVHYPLADLGDMAPRIETLVTALRGKSC